MTMRTTTPTKDKNDSPIPANDQQMIHENVCKRAYEIWVDNGFPDGCDQNHWLQAERELKELSEKSSPARKV